MCRQFRCERMDVFAKHNMRLHCDTAVASINSLLSAFPLRMEFMRVESERCCCADVDDGEFLCCSIVWDAISKNRQTCLHSLHCRQAEMCERVEQNPVEKTMKTGENPIEGEKAQLVQCDSTEKTEVKEKEMHREN